MSTVTATDLEAAGGEFDIARWTAGPDIDLGREPVEPVELAKRWAELEGIGSAV